MGKQLSPRKDKSPTTLAITEYCHREACTAGYKSFSSQTKTL